MNKITLAAAPDMEETQELSNNKEVEYETILKCD